MKPLDKKPINIKWAELVLHKIIKPHVWTNQSASRVTRVVIFMSLPAPGLRVLRHWLCWLCLIGQDAHCWVSYSVNTQGVHFFLFALRKMSSLYKPFCVSDGPCKDAIWRRGCKPQQHPAACLGVVASTLTPVHNVCEGKRRFAAAAPGGRKITHPGKAILAGK